jgi:hypothetical protein
MFLESSEFEHQMLPTPARAKKSLTRVRAVSSAFWSGRHCALLLLFGPRSGALLGRPLASSSHELELGLAPLFKIRFEARYNLAGMLMNE